MPGDYTVERNISAREVNRANVLGVLNREVVPVVRAIRERVNSINAAPGNLLTWRGASVELSSLFLSGSQEPDWSFAATSWSVEPTATIIEDATAPGGNVLRVTGAATGDNLAVWWLNVDASGLAYDVELGMFGQSAAQSGQAGMCIAFMGDESSQEFYLMTPNGTACRSGSTFTRSAATFTSWGNAGTYPRNAKLEVRGDKVDGLAPRFVCAVGANTRVAHNDRSMKHTEWDLTISSTTIVPKRVGLAVSWVSGAGSVDLDISAIRVRSLP